MTVIALSAAPSVEQPTVDTSPYARNMTWTFPLPSEVTSFVGRRSELTEIRKLLERTRAVVLTGPGGVGKTRLAVEAASLVRRAFAAVWFISVCDAPPNEIEALLERGAVDDAARRIAAQVTDRDVMLVLDGCDCLSEQCGVLIDRLLELCPTLTVLATSRRLVPSTGAVSWPVPPMSLPKSSVPPSKAAAVARSDAIALFVARATTAFPAFRLTDHNVEAVTRLCDLLDGIPLAIELAAGHIRAMSVEQLLDRLGPQFQLLIETRGSRAGLSLWQIIDDTFGDCSPAEQALWAAASVFEASFCLDDIEAVCVEEGSEAVAVAQLVTSLVDRSVFTGLRENNKRIEYRLLHIYRHYGRHKLAEQGTLTDVQNRHARWITDLAHATEPFWMGSQAVDDTDKLLRHHADILTVLRRELEADRPDDVLRIAIDLRVHWMVANASAEGIFWISTALDAYGLSDTLAAEALWTQAYLAVLDGRREYATQCLDRSRHLATELDSDLIAAHCDFVDGLAHWSDTDMVTAATRLETAFRAYLEHGLRSHQREALFILGMVLATGGTSELSLDTLDAHLADMGGETNWWGQGYVWWLRGFAALERGEIDASAALLQQCLGHMRSRNDYVIVWWCLELLAWVATERSEFRLAAELFGSARAFGPHTLPAVLRERHDHHLALTTRALGTQVTDKLIRKGTRLDNEQVIELALGPSATNPDGTAVTGGTEQLTEREMQVARLVAKGRSNKEIGATLVISARTAEGHVQRVLAKRGFNSRSQIAAWIAEHEHTEDDAEA